MVKERITVSIDKELKDYFKILAVKEKKTLGKYIDIALEKLKHELENK